MKIINANGVQGCLLNPYHQDGKWVFRVYIRTEHLRCGLRHSVFVLQ